MLGARIVQATPMAGAQGFPRAIEDAEKLIECLEEGGTCAMPISDTHRIDDLSWDQTTQAFTVRVSAHEVIVQAADFFDMRVRVRIRSGRTLIGVTDPVTSPVVPAPGATADSSGFVSLLPFTVPWDRNGGTFSGTATLVGNAALLSNRERAVERNQTIA
jgi:hypothetical protein